MKKIKMKKCIRRLTKQFVKIYNRADGFVELKGFEVRNDVKTNSYTITIKGIYGRKTDGMVRFVKNFELTYPDGSDIKYMCAIFEGFLMARGD